MNTRIRNFAALLPVAVAALIFGGCSMCCDTYDYDYPTFGGKHERADPAWGRVGSVFSDPGSMPTGPGADSNLEEVDTRSRFDDDDDVENLPDFGTDPTPGDEKLPDPNGTPKPDDTALRGNMKTKPLRSEWR